MSSAKYRRILLKVSGEMLAGEQGYGIQPSILEGLSEEIASVVALDVEVAVVIGGGNIFRGIAASASGMEHARMIWIVRQSGRRIYGTDARHRRTLVTFVS